MRLFKQSTVLWLKQILYGRRGEPYRVNGQTLRYLPGTRPIRIKYKDSRNVVNRYDALQVELFSLRLKSGDTVLDVGAHSGEYCLLMSAICGVQGNVVAFEPDPYVQRILKRNVELNPDLKPPRIETVALSDVDGEAVLYSRGGNSQSSLARSGVGGAGSDGAEPIRVRTTTLDAYLCKSGLPIPSWVKIDVEGAEFQVLKGGQSLLMGPTRIVCELHPYAWAELGTNLAELQNLVSKSGRRMHYLGSGLEIAQTAEYGTVLIEKA